jgi:hypothetical protein
MTKIKRMTATADGKEWEGGRTSVSYPIPNKEIRETRECNWVKSSSIVGR